MTFFFRWGEKRFRSVWFVERDGRSGLLVGTAHFSPHSFKRTLTRLIQRAETVLFEGPLDKESMARVVEYGRQGEGAPSLVEALSPEATREINRQLRERQDASTLTSSLTDLIQPVSVDLLDAHTRGVRPWMAFFTIWTALLGWKHSMDVEAFQIARNLGKQIGYLETIEDQLKALDGIPFERFVNYLNRIDQWKSYRDRYYRAFLSGDLDRFTSMTGIFPTRCESILARRDPIFFEGIKRQLEKGPTTAFVGSAHIPGIRKRFLEEGYRITQETA
jgi:hypothetical protein